MGLLSDPNSHQWKALSDAVSPLLSFGVCINHCYYSWRSEAWLPAANLGNFTTYNPGRRYRIFSEGLGHISSTPPHSYQAFPPQQTRCSHLTWSWKTEERKWGLALLSLDVSISHTSCFGLHSLAFIQSFRFWNMRKSPLTTISQIKGAMYSAALLVFKTVFKLHCFCIFKLSFKNTKMCFQKRYLNVFLVLYLDLGFRHQYLKSCDKYDEITVGEMSVT